MSTDADLPPVGTDNEVWQALQAALKAAPHGPELTDLLRRAAAEVAYLELCRRSSELRARRAEEALAKRS